MTWQEHFFRLSLTRRTKEEVITCILFVFLSELPAQKQLETHFLKVWKKNSVHDNIKRSYLLNSGPGGEQQSDENEGDGCISHVVFHCIYWVTAGGIGFTQEISTQKTMCHMLSEETVFPGRY